MDNNYGNGQYNNNGYGPVNQNNQNGYNQPNGGYNQSQQNGYGQNNGYGQSQQNSYNQPNNGYSQPQQNYGNQQMNGYGQNQQGYQQQNYNTQQTNNYGQNMGGGYMQSPVYTQPPKKKGGFLVVLIVLAMIAAVGIVGIMIVLNSNPKAQIAKAFKKTFETPYIIEELSKTDLADANGYNIGISLGDIESGEYVEAGFALDNNINFNLQADCVIDEEAIYGELSLVDYEIACKLNYDNIDMQFKFDVSEESELIDTILAESDMSLSDIKEILDETRSQTDKSNKNNDKDAEKINKACEEYINKLEFKKGNKDYVEIDNKKVECTTYNALLAEDDTEILFDEIYETLEEIDTNGELRDNLDTLIYDLFSDDELHLSVSIYKGKLAKISLKHGDITEESYDEIGIEFNGGEYRAQNMQMFVDDEVVFRIEGSSGDDYETYMFQAINDEDKLEDVIGYNYNKDSDTLLINVYNSDSDEKVEIKGNLNINKGIEYSTLIEDVSLALSIDPVKDTVDAVDVDNEYYINDMTEEEFAMIFMDFAGTDYDEPTWETPVIEESTWDEPVVETPEIEVGDLLNSDGTISLYIDNMEVILGETKYEVLADNGWTFDKEEYKFDDGTTTLAPYEYTFSTIHLNNDRYGTDWDSAEVVIGLCNPTDKDIDLYDAYIWSISTSSRTGFELLENYPIISLKNGLHTGDDTQRMFDMLGNYESIYESEYGYNSYSYEFDDIYLDICIYHDGGISEISADYYGWDK